MDMREAWKLVYREARIIEQLDHSSAYMNADKAVMNLSYLHDYLPLLEVFDAVLWAIHWKFYEPVNNPPARLSERHLCFTLGEDASEVWFERKLP